MNGLTAVMIAWGVTFVIVCTGSDEGSQLARVVARLVSALLR